MDSFFIGFTIIVGIFVIVLLVTDYFIDNRFVNLINIIRILEKRCENLEKKFISFQTSKIQSLGSH